MFCRNTRSLWSQSCLYLPADESYYIKKVNFWNAIPFSTSRCKIEGCEKRALSPRSLTESSAESELSRLDAHRDSLCGPVLITSSENYEKEGCETWSALPFWRSHCLDFLGASRFGVIAIYRWTCHEYRKQNQLNPALCVSICLTREYAPFGILNLTQPVRTDL